MAKLTLFENTPAIGHSKVVAAPDAAKEVSPKEIPFCVLKFQKKI